MIDHAHSIVIGETAVVGNNVSMLHAVTLAGLVKMMGIAIRKSPTGFDWRRCQGVGNITIGECSRMPQGRLCCMTSLPRKPWQVYPQRLLENLAAQHHRCRWIIT